MAKIQEIQRITIGDVVVPYRVARTYTQLIEGEEVQVAELPSYIINLQRLIERGNTYYLGLAKTQAGREALRFMKSDMGCRAYGWEAPILVSANMPKGCFTTTTDAIIVNEDDGVATAVDADGDRGAILPSSNGMVRSLFRKYPVTQVPKTLRYIDDDVPELFSDLTEELMEGALNQHLEAQRTFNEEQAFRKNHSGTADIGLFTTGWNDHELLQSESDDFRTKIERIYQDIGRFQDVEGKLKEARKDDDIKLLFGTSTIDVRQLEHTIAPWHKWAIQGKPKNLHWRHVSWLFDEPNVLETLRQRAEEARQLRVDFVARPKPPAPGPTASPPQADGELLNRLWQIGVFNYATLLQPKLAPNLPVGAMIWLSRPDGVPVALTETKRHGETGYCYLIPPIFDPRAEEIDSQGVATGRTSARFVSPTDHLSTWLSQHELGVRAGPLEPVIRNWPESIEDFYDPRYHFKINQVVKLISEWANTYGDIVPARATGNPTQPFGPYALDQIVCEHSVHLDYHHLDIDGKWATAKAASAIVRLALGGCKEANGMFMLSHPQATLDSFNLTYGVSCLADPMSHPFRTGKLRSQIIRALGTPEGKRIDMRVAIVYPQQNRRGDVIGTLTQCHITETGIAKQNPTAVPNPFLDRVATSLNEETAAIYTNKRYVPTLHGGTNIVWTRPAKGAAEIGKLVDWDGNKFVPRRFIRYVNDASVQVRTNRAEPIDLIIPITELLAKGNAWKFLAESEERTMWDGHVETKIRYGTFKFGRTGAASENVPPRWCWFLDQGLEGLKIRWELSKINENVSPEPPLPDFSYPTELLRALMLIEQNYGHVEPVDDWDCGDYNEEV